MPRAVRIAVLAALAALICWRMPDIILEGRFWAEEGKYFFANARTMPPLQALLTPFGGYLNIVATLGTLAARSLVPLADAPYVTIAISLLVQLITPAILLRAEDAWLRPPLVRIAACLVVILVPASEEIWLQTLHCQFQLALASAVIMALAVPGGRARASAHLLVLLIAPLSGPGAFAVLPFLLLRAALEPRRDRLQRAGQAAALATGIALQLGFFFDAGPGRSFTLQPTLYLLAFTVKHLVLPFLGVDEASALAPGLRAALQAGRAPPWTLLLPVGVFAALLASGLRRRSHVVLWLVGAGIGTAVLSYYGALGDGSLLVDAHLGERYGFVPGALFGLGVLALAATARGATRIVAGVATAWILFVGIRDYRDTWAFVSHGPSWHGQIKRWTQDHTVPVGLWPEGWTLRLK